MLLRFTLIVSLLFCLPTKVFSGVVVVNHETCPHKRCSEGELLGDDGICYSCYDPKNISVLCSLEKSKKDCPNRFLSVGKSDNLNESVLECPKNLILENGECRHIICEDHKGYRQIEEGCCPIGYENWPKDEHGCRYKEIVKIDGEEVKVGESCIVILQTN